MWQIFRPRGFKEALLSSIYDAMYQLRPNRIIPLGIADRGMTDIRVCGQLRGVGRSVASAAGRVGSRPVSRECCWSRGEAASRSQIQRLRKCRRPRESQTTGLNPYSSRPGPWGFFVFDASVVYVSGNTLPDRLPSFPDRCGAEYKMESSLSC